MQTRVSDLYSRPFDQIQEQLRILIEKVKEQHEDELINNPEYGLLANAAPSMKIGTRTGAPTPDDLDDLIAMVWKEPAFFLAHPAAIAAFGRECTRRGVPPPTPAWIASIANSLFRGVPIDVPPGTGANLPAAPVFAHEPVIASVPGAPSAAPPISPNLTPGVAGMPTPGASVPPAPVHGDEPLAAASESAPALAAAQPFGEKGAAGAAPASPSPPLPSAGPPQLPSGVQLSEIDLALVPSTLGGVMSVVPSLDNLGLLNGGLGASLPSAPVGAAEPLVPAEPGPTSLVPAAVPPAPSPGAPPSAPAFTFEQLKFVSSPSVAGLVQPSGQKGGDSWPQSEAAPYSLETIAGPGLGGARASESYYFLDEGLSASSRYGLSASSRYGWNGDVLNLGVLPSQHVPELALPPITGARQFAHIFRRDFPIRVFRKTGAPSWPRKSLFRHAFQDSQILAREVLA